MKTEVQMINGQTVMKIIAQNQVDETLLSEFFNKKNHAETEFIHFIKKRVSEQTKGIQELHIIKGRAIDEDELKKIGWIYISIDIRSGFNSVNMWRYKGTNWYLRISYSGKFAKLYRNVECWNLSGSDPQGDDNTYTVLMLTNSKGMVEKIICRTIEEIMAHVLA